ncbi:similar to Saccharomyces cerevisiae YHR138C Putative protein of unknown function [Maudiozyma barnettii]|uniref:Inhibitor I9 domain-containing protein n=1 Tax=Maudiozyma barnettii TaxID=61262 RepID=A0A8H2VI35_9SACH|nr:hypothetical protein [Kazachstania barnettii]CAB4255644.1 similar to Saccharomyces cerevisiae YHR138C Putative protein of unknown function [Kazachstania barnettii]CAD1784205.1 similar to Saccharomyces cerevisiae YHR138C Putative protein of unknown function [Kazachstania barnettii]
MNTLRIQKSFILTFCLILTFIFSMSQAKSTTSYILSIDNGDKATADSGSVLQNAKTLLTDFQGVITHEYSLINGLSFEMDPNIFTSNVQDKLISLGDKAGVKVNIEKDQDVHAFTGKH